MYKQIAFAIKCLFFGAIIALSFNSNLFAQKRIVRQNLGVATFYSDFSVMIAALQTGDTIYFPGAGYSIGDWSINQKVTIFGAGHYPDSTVATGTTALTGNIYLKTGADDTFIQGIYLTGNLIFGSSAGNQVVNNVTISRCSLNEVKLSYNGSATTTSNNIIIRDNVIRGTLMGGYATGVFVSNNITQQLLYFNNTLFKNNIHMFDIIYGYLLNNVNYSSFQNNVINYTGYGSDLMVTCNTNDFQNNAFNSVRVFPSGTNTGSGNFNSINPATFFVTQSGYVFSYSHNYHLQAPASYLGTDGIQIGIYGSSIPYKNGAVPINPHIRTKTIAPTTDCNGLLNIDIKVAAQNN